MPSERNAAPSTERCHECDRAVAAETNFCPDCGADLGDPSAPAYCPECGERFDDDDRFCSNCGAARSSESRTGEARTGEARTGEAQSDEARTGEAQSDEESAATAPERPSEADRSPSRRAPSPRETERAFRRRVQDHLDAGWEIERDDGDRVVLVDRGIGSVGVHVLLLIFTSGVGNLLYGWWHYAKLAERRRLVRGDSAPARFPSSADADGRLETVSAYLLTALLLLIGGWITALGVTSGSPPAALIGLAFALLGLGAAPAVRRRLDRRHGITAFGRRKTVDHRVIRPPESVDEPCVVCGERIDRGLVRRRRDETVAAGVPVRTHSLRHNHYCVDCARTAVFGDAVEAPSLDDSERGGETGEDSNRDSTDEPVRDPAGERLRDAND